MNSQPPSPRRSVATTTSEIVQSVRRTHYQHKPVVIDPATGTYELDCSEFVSYVLRQVTPAQYEEIPKSLNWPCPQAFEYCDFLQRLAPDGAGGWQCASTVDGATVVETIVGWQPIERVLDARPGDVIAWRRRRWKLGEDTGHVMVVAAKPQTINAGIVAVRVFDSADLAHFDDSRKSAGVFQSGVGMGTVHLHVDAAGAPTAFVFGPGDDAHAVPIVIGRLEPLARWTGFVIVPYSA